MLPSQPETSITLCRTSSVNCRTQHGKIKWEKKTNNARATRRSATALNKRLSAHQSATSGRQELDRFTSLCDSQKHTTCPDVHYSACLKRSNFLHQQNAVCPTVVHVSSSCCTLHIHALALTKQSLGESVTAISSSTLRGRPSNGVCSRDLVMSRASSESRISPLTASSVTRTTTSLHKSTFHSCASCSRIHVCWSPRCQVSATDKTHIWQYSRKIHSAWPSNDVVHSFLILGKLWAQFVDMALYLIPRQDFVNRSAPLSTPATLLKFRSPSAAFSWIHK